MCLSKELAEMKEHNNELNREIALYMLQEMKFRTDTAENGARAVEKVKASLEDPYDIIFMDV